MPGDPDLRLVPPTGEVVGGLEQHTDEDLMVAAAAGSREAFAVVVGRFLPRVTSYCAKLTGDPRVAEELGQDVMLAVWRTRATYRPERPFRVFVFTIARNRARNHARSWRRRLRWLGIAGAPEEVEAVPTIDLGQLDRVLDHERQRRVRRALGELPDKAREVLLLRFEQDLAYAEIAQIVGAPEATARSQVFHALRKLELALEADT